MVIGWCVGIGETFSGSVCTKFSLLFDSHFVMLLVQYPGYINFGSGPGTSGKIHLSTDWVFFDFVQSFMLILSGDPYR
jgi:hypothetical protein